MKAVVLLQVGPADTPGAFVVEDRPIPTPGPLDLLVKVLACGVCGQDQAYRAGLTQVELPFIGGHEVAGEVVEVGNAVTAFRVGQKVACKQFSTCGVCLPCRSGLELDCAQRRFQRGGMAEYVLIPQDALLPVPDGVDLTGAAIVACAVGSSYQALVRIARVLPGETVAVAGAGGGLGIHAVQIARALGSKVVALTSSADKIDLLRELGAAHVLLNRKGCYKDLLDITSGRGVDVVVDLVGHPDSFDDCFRGLSQRGRYVLAGQVYGRRVSVHPFFVFSTEKVITGSSSTLMSTFMHSMDLVQQGKVRPIVQTYPFAEAAKVHADMDGRRVMGRAVLVPPFS